VTRQEGAPSTAHERRLVLMVDAANVVGARADGWWKDRAGAAERLLADLSRLAETEMLLRAWPGRGDGDGAGGTGADDAGDDERAPAPEVLVVLEGRATAARTDAHHPGLAVVRAAQEGDDCVVEQVRARSGAEVLVVTSDRGLRQRVQEAGARVRGAGWLLRLLDEA
jgi:8-oxo-dGTP diphosphatase